MPVTSPRPVWIDEFPELAKVYDSWIARDVLPKDVFDALAKELKGSAFSAAGTMTDVVRERLLNLLGKALAEGMTVAEWQAATEGVFKSDAYASLVFRTNVTNAFDGARYGDMFGGAGEDYPAWRFNAVIDARNDEDDECPDQICRKLDGKVFLKSDVAARHLLPKVHWQCFVGETLVRARPLWISRFLYAGKVLHITTRGARRLTVTPNHPVLTPEGLAPANALRQGDYVLADRLDGSGAAMATSYIPEHDKPLPIEKMFQTFRGSGFSRSVAASGEEFHGDALGHQSDIEVVAPDLELLTEAESGFAELPREVIFIQAAAGQMSRSRSGAASSLPGRLLSATTGSPGGSALTLRLLPAHASPLQKLSLTSATNRFSGFLESLRERETRNTAPLSELIHREAASVERDEIVEICEFDFLGHVYDLQSKSGLLSAGGVHCSNCRCYVSEVSADEVGNAITASSTGLTAQDDWNFDKLSLAPKALSGGRK
jgi:hypothetical protein